MMDPYPLDAETLALLRTIPKDEARKYLNAYWGLNRLPPRRIREIHERLHKVIPPDPGAAWAPFFRSHPKAFLEEVIRWPQTAGQIRHGLGITTVDQDRIFDSVLRNKRTCVKSCNGGGKTWVGGVIATWAHNAGFRVLITASTLAQADAGVGAEIRRLKSLGPPGLSGQWMPSELHASYSDLHEMVTFSVAVGTAEEIAGSAAGRHYERMCLIIDEANSANAKLIEQVDRICLNPHDIVLALMNPTPPSCYMRKAAAVVGADGPLWNVLTINGENHPNVVYDDPDIIPGAITREMIADQLAKAGGNRKHFFFAPPVLGEWADSSSDSLIDEAWITAAQERWRANERKSDYRGTVLALDVASTGGDASSMWGCKDFRLFRPMIPTGYAQINAGRFPGLRPGATWLRGRESQESVDMVKAAIECVPDVRAVAIDATGLGDGPVSQLKRDRAKFPKIHVAVRDAERIQKTVEIQASVIGYHFAQAPIEPAKRKFKRFKDQLLWNLREALREGRYDLPPDHVLRSYGLPQDVDVIEELRRPFFGIDASGHLVIVDKQSAETGGDPEMAKRAKQLPAASANELHAIALAIWEHEKQPPGPKPIENAHELRQAELEKSKAESRKAHLAKTKRSTSRYPWQLKR